MTTVPLVITYGEPAGIGPEIVAKTWLDSHTDPDAPCFFLIGDEDHFHAQCKILNLTVPTIKITHPSEAAQFFHNKLPIYHLALAKMVAPGQPDPINADFVISCISQAVSWCQDMICSAMITNPIHKKTLYAKNFRFPGHTEFLAHLTKADHAGIMLLACQDLKVVPLTGHVPLKDVTSHLSIDRVVFYGRVIHQALRQDFGLENPRIVLAGLNPHAGEEGTIGKEEEEIFKPSIKILQNEDIAISGPFPADTLFHAEIRRHYDVALCAYHDQALIPLKTIDFYGGVNITLGLPIIRTSPDHGTAFDIAGKGVARADSLKAALEWAHRISLYRFKGSVIS